MTGFKPWSVGSACVLVAFASSCTLPGHDAVRLGPGVYRDPGGVLMLPTTDPLRVITFATTRATIPVQSEATAREYFVLAPGAAKWRSLEIGAFGRSELHVDGDGLYRLTSVPAGAGPPHAAAVERLRILVDRQPPQLTVTSVRDWNLVRGQAALSLSAVISDDLPLGTELTVLYSDDNGATWQRVAESRETRAEFRWPMPPEPLTGHLFRVTAVDGAGNIVAVERSLAQLIDRIERVTGSAPLVNAPTLAPHIDAPLGPGPEPLVPRETAREDQPAELTAPRALKPIPANSTLPSAAELWRALGSRSVLPAGAQLELPTASIEVLLQPADSAAIPLPVDVDATGRARVRLPTADGDEYVLIAKRGGVERRSSRFAIDGAPPLIRLEAIESTSFGVRIDWRATDLRSAVGLRAFLHLERDGVWEVEELARDAGSADETCSHELTLPTGQYRLYLRAVDGVGLDALEPTPPRGFSVERSLPRLLGIDGGTFRGGDRPKFHVDRIDPGEVDGPMEIVAVAKTTGETLAVGTVDATRDSVMWAIPHVTGVYHIEFRWQAPGGARRTAHNPGEFSIDSQAPELVWGPAPASLRGWVGLELSAANSAVAEPVARVEIYRRKLAAADIPVAEWERVPDSAAQVNSSGAGNISVEIDTASLPEGRVQLAAVLEDRQGNRSSEPIAGPELVIDRTPPQLDALRFPGTATEGVPVVLEWASVEAPSHVTMRWQREGATLVEHSPRITSVAGLCELEPMTWPAGRGPLELVVTDHAGNSAKKLFAFEVAEALTDLRVLPRLQWPGEEVLVRYRLAPPHPLPGRPLTFVVRDAAGADVFTLEIASGGERVVFPAPSAPGSYTVGFCQGPDRTLCARTATLEVPAVAAANSAKTTEQLLLSYRGYANRWREGERGPELVALHGRLAQDLAEAVAREPGRVALRRALASLFMYRTPPDYERGAQLLRDGMTLAPRAEQPDLLTDLAAFEAQLGHTQIAYELLAQALEIEDNARRRVNAARLLRRLVRPAEAAEQLWRAVELEPKNSDFRVEWAETVSELDLAHRNTQVQRLLRLLKLGHVSEADAESLEARIHRRPNP
ncbi:MAG: tetratricopeptide repeat protein [Planctomycetota bacterium]